MKQATKYSLTESLSERILRELLEKGGSVSVTALEPDALAAALPAAKAFCGTGAAGEKKMRNSLSHLKRSGAISTETRSGRTRISLTQKGEKRAQQAAAARPLAALSLKKQRSWDGKWRILMFDIEAGQRVKRNALRTLLKRIGFAYLQKSVFVYPFDCEKEVGLARRFFDLSHDELRFIVAVSIGEDVKYRRMFRI